MRRAGAVPPPTLDDSASTISCMTRAIPCMFVYLSLFIYVYIYIYIYICLPTPPLRPPLWTHTSLYPHYVCIYIYIYIFIYVCNIMIYIYISYYIACVESIALINNITMYQSLNHFCSAPPAPLECCEDETYVYIYIYIHIHIRIHDIYVCIYIYIYLRIHNTYNTSPSLSPYIYIYIYIYISDSSVAASALSRARNLHRDFTVISPTIISNSHWFSTAVLNFTPLESFVVFICVIKVFLL